MELSNPITDFAQLSADVLTDRLQKNGFLESGNVVSLKKTNSFDSSAANWDRIDVGFSEDYVGEVPEKLILKIYREGWFGGGVIEWTFYSELATKTPKAKVCPIYDCGIDHENRSCHFLMADLSKTHSDSPPEKEEERPYEAVITELLKYHIRWWNDNRLNEWPFFQRHGGPLRMAQAIDEEGVRASCNGFRNQLAKFIDQAGDELERSWVSIVERVIEGYPDAFLARISSEQNITLLHGDAHLYNVFYPRNSDTHDLILYDWETYKRGLGAYDLAYLLIHGTSKRRELEERLMNFYFDGLKKNGITNYSWGEFEYDFRLSVIACVFCPIIWKRIFSMKNAIDAFEDWNCDELLA